MMFKFFGKKKEKAKGPRAVISEFNFKEVRALQIASVFTCVRIISESIAMLPINIYKIVNGEKELAVKHPLYKIFRHKPNPNDTPVEFMEKLISDLAMSGNCYCYIVRGLGGAVQELWPINSANMHLERMADGSIYYRWQHLNGETMECTSFDKDFPIWHVKLFSNNGYSGVSPLDQLRELFDTASMTDQFWKQFLANGCNLTGKLICPETLTDEAFAKLKKDITETYTGVGNVGKFMILEGGLNFEVINKNSLSDSQFLETKNYILKQVAAVFKVPLHMVGMMEHSTYNNVEQQQINFLIQCLGPYISKFEQSIISNLTVDREWNKYVATFNTEGLLRMDMTARYKAHQIGIQSGFLSPNEARRKEELPGYEGGDKFIIPLNMARIDEYGNIETISNTPMPSEDIENVLGNKAPEKETEPGKEEQENE